MGRKTYLKIVMPSAPTVSFAPYDSQTIGLTTWDEAATIDGVTYHPARFALGDGTSTGDFSKGKGGLALGNQIASLEVENIFSGGFLKNYVDAGTIPLVGAVVTILDGVGATPQTWVIQEPSGDGPVLSFKLCTPGYLNQKRLQFAAMRYDGTSMMGMTVGVAIGDAAVQDVNAGARYKGVSVPTKTFTNWANKVTRINLKTFNCVGTFEDGNNNVFASVNEEISASSYGSSGELAGFRFVFSEVAKLETFWAEYIGYNSDGTWSKLHPSMTVFISDGTNSETILRTNKDGDVILGDGTSPAPLQVDATGTLASKSIYASTNSGLWGNEVHDGTRRGTRITPVSESINENKLIVDQLIFHRANYVNVSGTDTIQPTFYVRTQIGQPLASSSPENVFIYAFYGEEGAPVCVGAGSLVGFSDGDTIYKNPGEITNENSVMYVNPIALKPDGFDGFVSIVTKKEKIAFYSTDADVWQTLLDSVDLTGRIGNIYSMMEAGDFIMKVSDTISTSWQWKLLKNIEENSFDSLLVDFCVEMGLTADYLQEMTIGAFLPFIGGNVHLFGSLSGSGSASYSIPRIGLGTRPTGRAFGNADDLNSVNGSLLAVNSGFVQDYSFSESLTFFDIFGIKKISFGNNPAVVVPGNFPGTSNPTTTPALAPRRQTDIHWLHPRS